MKERILQLIQSTVWEDVLLGINLAYKLDLDTFIEIFDYTMFNVKYPGDTLFIRETVYCVFGYYNFFLWPSEDAEGFFDGYKDITPK